MAIYTVGHSTWDEESFLEIIKDIPVLMDIRSHPTSRWPQFTRNSLSASVSKANKDYIWEPGLGGWDVRHAHFAQTMEPHGVAINAYTKGAFPKQRIARGSQATLLPAWTNVGLYDYSWFMSLSEFIESADQLIKLGRQKDVAIMCAEVHWWRCHRSMVSDYLSYRGVESHHIMPRKTKTGIKSTIVPHSTVITNRLERYEPAIVDVWNNYTRWVTA